MAFTINDAERAAINNAAQTLFKNAGMSNGLSFNFSDQIDQIQTSRNITLWVDKAIGNDANPGTISSVPLATISEAIRRIPLNIAHTVLINIKAGNYAENLVMNFNFVGTGTLSFVGQDWTAFTPTTGIASGTFDASFGTPTIPNTAAVTGAGWTTNNLRGVFAKITSGANSGSYYPIGNNAAATADFGFPADRTTSNGRDLRSKTFELYTPAVIITPPSTTPATSAGIFISGSYPSVGVVQILFQNIKFDFNTIFTGVIMASSHVRFTQCLCVNNSSFNMISVGGGSIFRTMEVAFIPSSTMQYAITRSTTSQYPCGFSLVNPIFIGGQRHVGTLAGDTLVVSGLFQAATQESIEVYGSNLSITGSLVIQNSAVGILFGVGGGAGSGVTLVPGAGLGNILNCTTGIYARYFNTGIGDGVKCHMNNMLFDGCTNAILLETYGNLIQMETVTIRNSSAWGVNAGGRKTAGFNQICTTSATAMSSNVSGDFTLDGTVAISLANLRADPDKDIAEVIRFSRLVEL